MSAVLPAKGHQIESDKTALSVVKEFSSSEEQFAVVETAGTAAAAKAKSTVEARYLMALRNPRNMDQVRQDLLKECRRPAFADNKSAYYRKPIGAGVEGLGIRFVEVALRCMRNVLVESELVFEDDVKEVHRVCVTDLESNLTYPMDVRVSKTVERSKPMDDGGYLSMRLNSQKRPVYTVPGTDDDLLNKRAALISKAIRTVGLRIIPGDFQDEAEAIIKQVRLDKAAQDPAAERKKIADAFAEIGVKVIDLEAYLEHKLDTCSPTELVNLRGVYGAIRDGEATWKEVMDNKADQAGGGGEGDGGIKQPKKKEADKPAATDTGASKPAVAAKPDATPSAPALTEYTFIDGDGLLLTKLNLESLQVSQDIELEGMPFHVVEIDANTHFAVVKSPDAQAPEAQRQPDPEPAAFVPASAGMKKQIIEAMKRSSLSTSDLEKRFGFGIDAIPASQVTSVFGWIKNPAGK